MNTLLIILAGSLVAVSCGLLGCYLILRRMAMMGDAISHAVLPGIVVAFLIAGHRDSLVMVLGAGLVGVLTTVIIQFLHEKGKLQADASIGVTFTWLFAVGIILVSAFTGQVDLDQECVLYGEIAYVPLDLWYWDDTPMGPRVIWTSGIVLVIVLLLIRLAYKELYLTTFDPAFASAIGLSTTLWTYVLMSAVSLVTVASFEAVGAILVVALLIAPPATAYLLTHRFSHLLALTAFLGVIETILGYVLAVWVDGSIAGAIATVSGIFFLLAWIFAPGEGLWSRQRMKKTEHSATF